MNLVNRSAKLLVFLTNRTSKQLETDNTKEIIAATNEFANRVTTPNTTKNAAERAIWIDECFDKEARLRGTVSQVIRTKTSNPTIKNYFADYFSQSIIPTLTIKNADYNINRLGPNMYENLAYVQFSSIDGEVTAEMSFIFKKDETSNKWLIILLDSNPIYQKVPDELIKGGDIFKLWDLANDTDELTDERKMRWDLENQKVIFENS